MENNAAAQSRDVFSELFRIDVNEKVEKKNGLNYLSWAWAWAEVRKRFADANYIILRNKDDMPFFYDERVGIECRTMVTIGEEMHEMWLPVMDSNNKPMFFQPYQYDTKSGKRTVPAATMFDINKTIMRCLAKNLAMFGLGLYIYAGEDYPEEPEKEDLELAMAMVEQEIARIRQIKSKEEMRALAENIVKPTIGVMNFKACADVDKLKELYQKLSNVN